MKNSDMVFNIAYSAKYFQKKEKFKKAGESVKLHKLEVGRYLCLLRLTIGLNQQEVAAKLGITRESWNRIEAGCHLPKQCRIKSIASLFKTSASNLFDRCGYYVDKSFPDYEVNEAIESLQSSFIEADNKSEFIMNAGIIWDEYRGEAVQDYESDRKLHQIIKKRKYMYYDTVFMQTINQITHNLAPVKQTQLAKEILTGESSIILQLDPKSKEIVREIYDWLHSFYSRKKAHRKNKIN